MLMEILVTSESGVHSTDKYFKMGLAYLITQPSFGPDLTLHEAAFQKAIDIDPKNPDLRYKIGEAYREFGSLALAENQFQEAIELDPKHTNSYYRLANISHRNGDIENAIKYLDSALELDAEDLVNILLEDS